MLDSCCYLTARHWRGQPIPDGEASLPRKHDLRRRALKLFITLAIQGLIALVLLELLARVVDPLGISYYPETAKFLDQAIREEPIGYRFPPHLDGEFWGAQVTLNSLGMRDREVPRPRPGDEYRILMLGDSWTFGLGVGNEDTIPRQLEDQLNEHAEDGRRYRTLNTGIPSYNTEQELISLQQLGLGLDPQAVVLMFASNDIESKTWVLDKRQGLVVNVAQRSYAASLLTILARRVRQVMGAKPKLVAIDAFEPTNPRWLALEESMRRIHAICREKGMPFVVFASHLGDGKFMGMLHDLGEREGFPVVNLRPDLDPRWADRPMPELQNSAVDSHPNREGCAVQATLMRESLIELEVLP